jgi:hypothetical protein
MGDISGTSIDENAGKAVLFPVAYLWLVNTAGEWW